jgi:putative transcriptional regulator
VSRPPAITNRIRRLRFERGEMTQAELAARIGLTRQTVAAIEQGKYSPTLEAAFRIAEALGEPLQAVFQWQGEEGGRLTPTHPGSSPD